MSTSVYKEMNNFEQRLPSRTYSFFACKTLGKISTL